MPPDVFVGRTVCVAGKIKTYDGGRSWMVIEAVPIPEGRAAMQKFMALLDQTCANPAEWCPDLLDGKARRGKSAGHHGNHHS